MFWISYSVTVALCSVFALFVMTIRFAISVIVRALRFGPPCRRRA
jgi:hypothetical protein